MYEEQAGDWDSESLVGRQRELALFLKERNDAGQSLRIISVYGTSGVGKSSLLDEFQRLARDRDDLCITVDSEGFVKTPEAFCKHVLDAVEPGQPAEREAAELPAACVQALARLAGERRICLFIDAYEQMESMDQWLREFFLKRLGRGVLVVLAGRYPLSEAWLLSPAWRRLITRIPLAELDFTAVTRFADYMHIRNPEAVQKIWRYSRGHPLTMSLIAFLLGQDGQWLRDDEPDSYDTLAFIVNQWMREVPGEHMRPLIEAACVLRRFNQESLSSVLGREMSASEFYQLIRFSFIRKADQGWAVHSLMRELACRELLSRTPQQYEQLRAGALRYHYGRLASSGSGTAEQHEAVELMYYIGDALIRAFMNWFELAPPHFETAQEQQKDELKAYAARRLAEAKDSTIEMYDPYSNRRFTFRLTAKESRDTVLKLDFDALFALGYDVVRIMKDPAGNIIGFAVIIPINEDTLPYLEQAPRSKPYFGSLPPEMRRRLAAAPHSRSGWFIETIDTADLGDVLQQTAMAYLLHDLIFTGELLIESPAPTEYFTEAHKSLGFTVAEHGRHFNYDEEREAVTFVLDRQGGHGLRYIRHMLGITGQAHLIEDGSVAREQTEPAGHAGQPPMQPPPAESNEERIMGRNGLTPREKEVALLLEKGSTNAEIAKALYLSEVTVKKHLRSMMEKLDASNRTQLLRRLLE